MKVDQSAQYIPSATIATVESDNSPTKTLQDFDTAGDLLKNPLSTDNDDSKVSLKDQLGGSFWNFNMREQSKAREALVTKQNTFAFKDI